MRIVIAGGSGFLGQALTTYLSAGGHEIIVLGRGAGSASSQSQVRAVHWTPDGKSGRWADAVDGADAIVNLAGAGIADRRWTAARKQLLLDSRVNSTRSLIAALRAARAKPAVFVQQSAVGFYGSFDNGPDCDERSAPGTDFLARICVAWEAEAQPAAGSGSRLVVLRTGIVLSHSGGALKRMLLPFRLFVGGRIGSGRQVMSWIHLDDWVGMTVWAITNPAVSGPLNVTAPNPVPNAEMARAIGRAVHRPSVFPVPGIVMKTVFGEMATDTLLRGQRVLPRRATELGFQFLYPTIDQAMPAALS
ncbi:MAG TPA: TIGR01777 family oxidoreductase [Vicinamibacterales bacterium]|nr:TIGR01777 family oxidoreductase [Vicinamibacterales bacterium]